MQSIYFLIIHPWYYFLQHVLEVEVLHVEVDSLVKTLDLLLLCPLSPQTKEAYYYRRIFENKFPGPAAAECFPNDLAATVACSTAKAIEWDAEFKKIVERGGDASGRGTASLPSLKSLKPQNACTALFSSPCYDSIFYPNFAAASVHEDAYANASEPPAKKTKTDEQNLQIKMPFLHIIRCCKHYLFTLYWSNI